MSKPDKRWISANEKLPNKNKNVLVAQLWNKNFKTVSMGTFIGNSWCCYDDEYIIPGFKYDVIAWMELPDPYEVKDENGCAVS